MFAPSPPLRRVDPDRPRSRGNSSFHGSDAMVQLVPIPFGVLIGRLFRELDQRQSAFDLPRQRFVQGYPGRDLSIAVHRRRASTPFGPAAGPHTQMAQNIVLSWLAGGRVIELKTVQVKDDLVIPRPCIDMETVGFNVEWSQELTIDQSLEEYVKGSMLIEMLKASGLAPDLGRTVFDMSVGYDLAGVRSAKVRAFFTGMMDATPIVERLRAQIPDAWRHLRNLPFASRISDTLTLSTFHGCPPDEIEAIVRYLLAEIGLDVVVKLNPTLLGRDELGSILYDRMGYAEIKVPDAAFADDANWEQIAGLVERLGPQAAALGRGFGVKFSNTLVVENHKSFFPASERRMYLSGPPLHPLAIALARRFRRTFGDRFPISFSAGVDELNFADAVGLGLTPVTVCSDLLKPGGYRRGSRYLGQLVKRMDEVGAADIDAFVLRAHGQAEAALAGLGLTDEQSAACRAALRQAGDLRAAAGKAFPAWVSAARLLNTEVYAERALADRRYGAAENATPPNRVESALVLFDCLTCDKCIPICPNDANFSFVIPPGVLPIERLTPNGEGWSVETSGTLCIAKAHQIGAFADACNECGHCDVLCPEDGGPYLAKPLFFGSAESWAASPHRDGFVLEKGRNGLAMRGRFKGRAVAMERDGGLIRYRGDGFDVVFDPNDVASTAKGVADGPVELTPLRIMNAILEGITAPRAINYVRAGLEYARAP
jgi:putative selenate reductase